MSGVVALGPHAGPFLERPVHVVHADPALVLADLPALYDLLRGQLAQAGPSVVIYPSTLGGRAPRALATVRAALDGAPLLWHATDLPPLAADVLVTLAGALERPLGGAHVVAAVLPLLEQQLVQLTWVPSVARLRDPAPSVWQHARSVAPGSSWLVTSWPEPAVRRLDPTAPPALPRSSQQVGVALADLDGEVGWVGPAMAQLPDAVGVQVAPPDGTADWWGCRRVTQVVVHPRSVDALAGALTRHVDPGPCSWCRRDVGSATCPWCQLPRSGLTRQGTADAPDPSGALLATAAPGQEGGR